MSTARSHRVRGRGDEVGARRSQRRRQADSEVARIERFDDVLLKVLAWVAIAVFIAAAIAVLIA